MSVMTTAPRSRWASFRHAKMIGLPAPIVAAVLAVLLIGGAAYAAVIFSARMQADRNVKAAPSLSWEPPSATGFLDGAACTVAGTGTNTLTVTIDGYAGGSCDVAAQVKISQVGKYKVAGIDMGTGVAASLVSGPTDVFGPTFNVGKTTFIALNQPPASN